MGKIDKFSESFYKIVEIFLEIFAKYWLSLFWKKFIEILNKILRKFLSGKFVFYLVAL